MSERVARSRELVARGYALAAVARVLQVTRQAIYRVPKPRQAPKRESPAGEVDEAIVETAKANPTDGYRLVSALCPRRLGRAVNRKRVLRAMRDQRLIQPRRAVGRLRRPGYFRVERPAQLWHTDMTAVWVAEHGWCYLNAIIDCCTREIIGWSLETRCRAAEAIAVVERAISAEAIAPESLTLGTDNGSAYTARTFKAREYAPTTSRIAFGPPAVALRAAPSLSRAAVQLDLPRLRGHVAARRLPFPSSPWLGESVPRTRPARGTRASSAGAAGCTSSRSTRRPPSAPLPAWARTAGESAPS